MLRSQPPLKRGAPQGRPPGWWRTTLERLTRAGRAARAQELLELGEARRAEASWVRRIVQEQGGYLRWLFGQEGHLPPLRSEEPSPDEPLGATYQGERLSAILYRWSLEERRRRPSTIDDAVADTAPQLDRLMVGHDVVELLPLPEEPWPRWRDRVLRAAEDRLTSDWHRARAVASLERFERLERCGEPLGSIVCRACGTVHGVHRWHCEQPLLCSACRARRVKRDRARVARARSAWLEAVRRRRWDRGRDPLIERFLTLTAPRLPAGPNQLERTVRIFRDALRRFWNQLRRTWKQRELASWRRGAGQRAITYVRTLEATPGRDERGHFHCHAITLSPFVPRLVLEILWGRALRRAGWPADGWTGETITKAEVLERLVEDRRAGKPAEHWIAWAKRQLPRGEPIWRPFVKPIRVRDGTAKDQIAELVKYVVKDVSRYAKDGTARWTTPHVYAQLLAGLAGARLLSAGRGFLRLGRAGPAKCRDCGTEGEVRAVFERAEQARGPPCQLVLPCVA